MNKGDHWRNQENKNINTARDIDHIDNNKSNNDKNNLIAARVICNCEKSKQNATV